MCIRTARITHYHLKISTTFASMMSSTLSRKWRAIATNYHLHVIKQPVQGSCHQTKVHIYSELRQSIYGHFILRCTNTYDDYFVYRPRIYHISKRINVIDCNHLCLLHVLFAMADTDFKSLIASYLTGIYRFPVGCH